MRLVYRVLPKSGGTVQLPVGVVVKEQLFVGACECRLHNVDVTVGIARFFAVEVHFR